MYMYVLNKMRYINFKDSEIKYEKDSAILKVLYNTCIGRIFLKVITKPIISKIIGNILSKKISVIFIKRYVKKHSIKFAEFEKDKYDSFNDFFTRKLKKIKQSSKEEEFISTAESKIMYYKISKDLIIHVKNTKYSIKELIKDEEAASEYNEGICLVYRLSPNNYHRYIFVDEGNIQKTKKIKGKLHTVNPISYDKYKVFSENYREVSILKTKNFDNIIQIEIGALGVGKISNNNILNFKRYEEKGFFEFGGSTIVQLIKKDKINIDTQIINNSKQNIETKVNIADVIGKITKN